MPRFHPRKQEAVSPDEYFQILNSEFGDKEFKEIIESGDHLAPLVKSKGWVILKESLARLLDYRTQELINVDLGSSLGTAYSLQAEIRIIKSIIYTPHEIIEDAKRALVNKKINDNIEHNEDHVGSMFAPHNKKII